MGGVKIVFSGKAGRVNYLYNTLFNLLGAQ